MQNVMAVESITWSRRFSTSKWLMSVSFTASGSSCGSARVHAVDARVRALQDRLGADLRGAQRGGRVGREVRVAGAGREHDDAGPSRGDGSRAAGCTAPRPATCDRGLHARRLVDGLQRVLQRERVDDGREHAHVVGAGAVHAARRAAHAPQDVAATDDDRDLDAEIGASARDLVGDALHDDGVDAVPDASCRRTPHPRASAPLGGTGSRASASRSLWWPASLVLADLDTDEAPDLGLGAEAFDELRRRSSSAPSRTPARAGSCP